MIVQIQKNAYFAYIRELEYMAAVGGMLADNLDGHLCREIFTADFIEHFRHKHRELAEIINSMKLGGFEFIEFLMSYKGHFTLTDYKKFILDMPLVDYVYHFFGYTATKEEIKKALEDESYLSRLYDEQKFYINSFVNLKLIIFNREDIVNKYFSCVEELHTPELKEYLDCCAEQLSDLQGEIVSLSKLMSPTEILTDFFHNRFFQNKSFNNYGFIPVFMLPRNMVTYFNQDAFILYSSNRISEQESALTMLKTISDDTRLRIIDLIAERNKENAKHLSCCLQLAPSTISHHMELLVSSGLVKEVKIGNTKYYSIEHEQAEKLIEQLQGILLKNNEVNG